MKLIVFIVLALSVTNIKAKILPANALKSSQNKLRELKRDILGHDKKIILLRSNLKKLERSLGVQNKNFLETTKKKQDMESRMELLNDGLKSSQESIKKLNRKSIKTYEKILVSAMGQETGLRSMIKRDLLMQSFQAHVVELKKALDTSQVLSASMQALKSRFQKYVELESELNQIIWDMEGRKKKLASSYLEQVELKEKQEKQLSLVKKTLKKKTLDQIQNLKLPFVGEFINPVVQYYKVKETKKGINYFIKSHRDVVAVGKGKVVFSGPLGGYGNLIMLDHGKEIRTIVLGNFRTMVKKGQEVLQGQKLANMRATYARPEKLYLEVRVKNKAQTTVHWLKDKLESHIL